jgi:hypothetical protein
MGDVSSLSISTLQTFVTFFGQFLVDFRTLVLFTVFTPVTPRASTGLNRILAEFHEFLQQQWLTIS